MKKYCLLLLLSVVAMAQNYTPVSDPSTATFTNGTFSWTLTIDTTQAMYGPPPPGSHTPTGPFYHTAYVYITATNKRTGVTTTGSSQKTGGIATVTASLAAQDGDLIEYNATETVYCPASGTTYGGPSLGYFRVSNGSALVTSVSTSRGTSGGTYGYYTYTVKDNCSQPSNIQVAGKDPGLIEDGVNTDGPVIRVRALCWSPNGLQPWACYWPGITYVPQGNYIYPSNIDKANDTVIPDTGCTYN